MKFSKSLLSKSFLMALASALIVSSFAGCTNRKEQQKDEQFNPAENQEQQKEENKEDKPQTEEKDKEKTEENKEETKEEVPSEPASASKPTAVQKPVTQAPQPQNPAPQYNPPKQPYIPPAKPKEPELVAMFYDEPGTFDKDMFIKSALIQSKDVHLKNKTIKGDVVIDSHTSGSVYLDNVLVEGKIIVESSAIDNLYLNDVQCKDVYFNNVGKYFSVETSGKTILDNVSTKKSATFMEYDLHPKCDGLVNISVEENSDPYGTNIDITSCHLSSMTINTPCTLKGDKRGAYIDRLTTRRRTDVLENVFVRDAVNYSAETRYYNEPKYIEHRGNAADKFGSNSGNNGSGYDKYDKYEEIYEPVMTVYNSNGNLSVEFEEIDPKTRHIVVKLYIDGAYKGSETVRRRSNGYADAEFIDGGRYDLRYTKKEIKAYAVPSNEDRYSYSSTVTWKSKNVPEPTVAFDTNVTPSTATLTGLDRTKYDYSYSFTSTDGTGTSLTADTIDVSSQRGQKLYIRCQLNQATLDATSTGFVVKTIDIPN